VTGNAKEANEVEITEFYVDLANETTRADLRHRWSAQRLVLKDKSLKKSMAADQSLVGDVKGYLTRMHEFQKEMMTHPELLDWLRTSWPDGSASASSSAPAGADTRAHETGDRVDRVAELTFAENRAINETGHVLGPMLQWFRSAYPYYHSKCLGCGNDDTVRLGTLRANSAEEEFAAARTEVYYCPKCLNYSRFPRYNQLRKVLQEERGRCGEYSMVFYHLMLALGYKTRWVVDWTDHVWVEVLIDSTWVHIDPCEAAYNDKKMYVGWGKKHTYVVAFAGGDEILFEDVTAEYAASMDEVRKRRDLTDADLAASLHAAVDEWNNERDESVKLLARCDGRVCVCVCVCV
jgi:peptide-N4-(N-acetyl-beta-glucosaminyl)asparagine amidase